MRTTTPPTRGRPQAAPSRPVHSNSGGEKGVPEPSPPRSDSYWSRTRRPLPCLVFILPILAAYELGVSWISAGRAGALRTGADVWVRQALGGLGLTWQWWPPLVIMLVLAARLMLDRRHSLRFRPGCLAGMALESGLLAVGLVGLGRLLDLAFVEVEQGHVLLATTGPTIAGRSAAPLIGFLGAGLYEEVLFRLVLVPLLSNALKLLRGPEMLAGSLSVAGSALVFALAHHAGSPGEPFTWFAFVFRWLAGVYFAWIFLLRGIGIAVGTHTAYDILVGWLDWHL